MFALRTMGIDVKDFPDFAPERVVFESRGDSEQDAKTASDIRRHLRNESEGLCPNGDAVMGATDADGLAICPGCGFQRVTRTLNLG
jgi:hypothetical protein